MLRRYAYRQNIERILVDIALQDYTRFSRRKPDYGLLLMEFEVGEGEYREHHSPQFSVAAIPSSVNIRSNASLASCCPELRAALGGLQRRKYVLFSRLFFCWEGWTCVAPMVSAKTPPRRAGAWIHDDSHFVRADASWDLYRLTMTTTMLRLLRPSPPPCELRDPCARFRAAEPWTQIRASRPRFPGAY